MVLIFLLWRQGKEVRRLQEILGFHTDFTKIQTKGAFHWEIRI